jgi:TRAP-type C4-dicarboxylate transport system permease small subunit
MSSSTVRGRILQVLQGVQVWMSHLTLSLTVGALLLQIACRQLGWQVDWTEELARFSFLVMVFASASFASGRLTHLHVSVFSDLAARWPVSRWLVAKFQLACILLFDGLFCGLAVANIVEGFRYPTVSPSLGFNESLLFLAPAVFFATAIAQRLLRLSEPVSPGLQDQPA